MIDILCFNILQIFPGRSKVMEWVKQQPDCSTEHEDTLALNLLETTKVNHIVTSGADSSLITKFSMSELSGSIGIASTLEKASLSVIYPGTDKPPLILSTDGVNTSALFMLISDQEYLAAASEDKIHLWNLVKKTSSVAHNLIERQDWYLRMIDDRTVACIAEQASLDGFSKIHIFNVDSGNFNLSSTIRLKAGLGITDMCYTKARDRSSCLLLSNVVQGLVKSVDMVGGRVRW